MRRHLSPALIISCLALFVALSGTGYAISKLPNNSVGTAQIKKDAVTSPKVKNGSLLAEDFKAGQLPRGEKGETGATGAKGETGTTGAKGETGAQGTARAYAFVRANGSIDPDRSRGIDQANVTKGQGAADTGFYCISGLAFTARSAMAVGATDSVFSPAKITIAVATPGQTLAVSGCAGTVVLVSTRDSAGSSADAPFILWLED